MIYCLYLIYIYIFIECLVVGEFVLLFELDTKKSLVY
jgi:hypothetical protein